MNYQPTRINVDGNLPVQRSVTAGDTPSGLNAGELAVNAADGVLYVGLNTGKSATVPRALGFSRIEALTQSAYDAITATVSSTTLYIVTPNPS